MTAVRLLSRVSVPAHLVACSKSPLQFQFPIVGVGDINIAIFIDGNPGR
jgi:hypothetical protein